MYKYQNIGLLQLPKLFNKSHIYVYILLTYLHTKSSMLIVLFKLDIYMLNILYTI